uniref:Uncharacterized protein n=1 Tax=Anopheles culicifacies TaxID=139723 RepID=A0A182M6Z4_9DIPT
MHTFREVPSPTADRVTWPGPIGASIVAMCPKNVGLHTNPALAMCKPTFEVRPPSIAPTPMMLVPRDASYKPTVTTPTANSGTGPTLTALSNSTTSTNNNSTTVANNNSSNGTGTKTIANSTSQCNIVKSTSGQLTNSVRKSNGTTAKEMAEEKSFL